MTSTFESRLGVGGLSRIGDVRLRLDVELLIGERIQPQARTVDTPEVFGLTAVATVVGAWAAELAGWSLMSALLLLCAAGLAVAGFRSARRKRYRRVFLLHFLARTLRLDLGSPFSSYRTRVWRFDQVQGLEIEPAPGGGAFQLWVTVEPARADRPPERLLIVDAVPPSQIESLRRLWRLLRGAFGLAHGEGRELI